MLSLASYTYITPFSLTCGFHVKKMVFLLLDLYISLTNTWILHVSERDIV